MEIVTQEEMKDALDKAVKDASLKKAMKIVSSISQETVDLLTSKEFERSIKYIARDFGAEATLTDIRKAMLCLKPVPNVMVDGKRYMAGYSGMDMIAEGWHEMKLVKVFQHGSTAKFMFVNKDDLYLYFTTDINSLKFNDIVKYSTMIGESSRVRVEYDLVKNTGEHHAIIAEVEMIDAKSVISTEKNETELS